MTAPRGRLGLLPAVCLLAGCTSASQTSAEGTGAPSLTGTPPDASCEPAAEVCDWQDNDCDGQIDEGLDVDLDGWTPCAGDCDDADPLVHPNAVELCDGLDTNCDGASDADVDLDGALDCADCAPSDPAISPLEAEVPGNGEDDDCDGWTDEVMFQPWSGTTPLLRGAPTNGVMGFSLVPYGPWGSLLSASTVPSCLIIIDGPQPSSPALFPDACQVALPDVYAEFGGFPEVIAVQPGQQTAVVRNSGVRPLSLFDGGGYVSLLGLAALPGPAELPAWHPLLDPEGELLGGVTWVDDPADATLLLVGRDDKVARVDLTGVEPVRWLPGVDWELPQWPSPSPPSLEIDELLGGCDLDGNGVGVALQAQGHLWLHAA